MMTNTVFFFFLKDVWRVMRSLAHRALKKWECVTARVWKFAHADFGIFRKAKDQKCTSVCVCAFISLCAHFWRNVCLRGRPCLSVKERVPGRACGRGRLWEMEGVKSSVWGICQRSVLDRGDHWDEKGGRAPGVERDRDYWGLGALTTGRMAAHHLQTHTHTHLCHCVLFTSSGYTCPALQRLRAKPRVNKIVFLSGWKCALLCLQNNDMGNKSLALEPLQALKCQQLEENRVVRIKVEAK